MRVPPVRAVVLVAALVLAPGFAPAAHAQQACGDADPRAAATMLAVADSAPAMQPVAVRSWTQLAAGTGGPVLVVTTSADPFSGYLAEILRAEGLNAFATLDLSAVTPATLAAYDAVLLGAMPVTAGQATMFADWVNAGGTLVAMRPDPDLHALLGITGTGTTLANAYLLIDTSSGPGAGLVAQTIQFHGTADRWTTAGATAVATLYSDAATPTANPAVTLRGVGANGGRAAAFAYDLARSVVTTRQGNPAWVGQKRDGQIEPIRSDDLFFGAATGDPQPDWIDFSRVAIPQADEQQRLLANLLIQCVLHRKPLPRFWYLPKGLKAAVVMTGDNHGDTGMQPRFDLYRNQSPAGCSVADWECVRATGYQYVGTAFTNAQAQFYTSLGFEVALHVNTGCARNTPAQYASFLSTQLGAFQQALPGIPSPTTQRYHCLAWNGWAEPAAAEVAYGIRLDTSYYYWPASWAQNRPGMFTGSGFPMRYAATDGSLVDCYQAVTQMTDESQFSYPQFCNVLLDRATGPEGYYGVFTANMHFDQVPQAASDQIVASAQAHGVPVVSAKQMLAWLDGRNGSSFDSLAWSGSTLAFRVTLAPGSRNIRGMLPVHSAGGLLVSITRDGAPVTTTTETIKGIAYAFFPAQAGGYVATYTADTVPPMISGVQELPIASDAMTIRWSTDEPADSRVEYGIGALSLAASDVGTGLVHALRLDNLSPRTRYWYRVRSVDVAGNAAWWPPLASPPDSFTTPSQACVVDDAADDFLEGSGGPGIAVARDVGGSVMLRPAVFTEFATLPPASEWATYPWMSGGTANAYAGALVLDGARFNTQPESATWGPGTSVEFAATFGAQGFQSIGLGAGTDLPPNGVFEASPFAVFSSSSDASGVVTRVMRPSGPPFIDHVLDIGLIGTPHRYRIDWNAGGFDFYVDGTLVHTEPVVVTQPMRPACSDYLAGGAALAVDWVRVSPYGANGTFFSRVGDAGSVTTWSSLLWVADVPSGTSLTMAMRAGDTPVPDGSWSAFVPVETPGLKTDLRARYVQYRAELATTDPRRTPELHEVDITCCLGANAPPAIADLALERLATDANGDGTRQVKLTFTTPAGSAAVEVYRAAFGNHPYYGRGPGAGSVPPAPAAYPPDATRWTLTAVGASGQLDEPAARDEYYYVAYAKNDCGTASTPSNVTGGVLDYALGDVHDGVAGHECAGNNRVFLEDLSLLGAHYGRPVGTADALACLDVGPTADGGAASRPVPDGQLGFEDLMVLSLNFGPTPHVWAVSAPPAAARVAPGETGGDRIALAAPGTATAGDVFTATLTLASSGALCGATVRLAWDATVCEPIGVDAGELARTQNALVLSPAPGIVDAARLGGAFQGSGVLAEVRFRALAAGDPGVRVATAAGRDRANRPVALGPAASGGPRPVRTTLGFAAPNPFRSALGVQLAIAHTQRVRLTVYDLAGRTVRTLVDGEQPPGTRVVVWNGDDRSGRASPAGVYLLRLESEDTRQVRRVQLLR